MNTEKHGFAQLEAMGVGLATLAAGRRVEMLRRLEAGDLRELEFEAIVYRAGPNRNHLRIRDEDLPGFAASFVGTPFLRDHRVEAVEARAGTVVSSVLDGHAIRQTIRLTTQRDIRAFLEGQIDRFSVSWFYDAVLCSVCGQEWGGCGHKPGRTYALGGERRRCELLFVNPVGKEVSAVNAPAVEGTRVTSELETFSTQGREGRKGARNNDIDAEAQGHRDTQRDQGLANGWSHAAAGAPSRIISGKGIATMNVVNEVVASGPPVGPEEEARLWVEALRAEVVEGMVARAGLSAGGAAAVRAALEGEVTPMPERVRRLVDAQRQAELSNGTARLAAGVGAGVVRGIHPTTGAITGMRTAEDEVQAAFNWLAGDTRTPMPAPHLRSLRDLYLAVTGDVNFWGVFNPDFARLQSANSSTLAGMAVNALNKAVLLHYDNLITYRWYEPIVQVIPHDGSTQPVQLIHMDGIAALPAVSEGAPYTEATTGDSKETATFTKYGSYVGITLEMIRRSDIGRIQAIPRLLTQAAIRRRSAAVAAIFTSNPTLADDSTALFHSNHGNTDTTAFGAAAWEAARTRIFEQTIPGTGKPLGIWPTFCLTPIELYDDALTAFGYGSGDVGKPNAAGTAQEPNIYAFSRPGDPRPIPIVVPEWSDATDWAYIVDPRLHPVIVMAYAGAPAGGVHALPEIFEVRAETAGLLFSHDTLPVKVRDWWACGVTTHVGVGKNTVAG